METGRFKEREGACSRKVLDVCRGNISNHIMVGIHDSQRGNPFGIHHLQSLQNSLVTVDGYDLRRTKVQLSERQRQYLIDRGEGFGVGPKELENLQLADHPNDAIGSFLYYRNPVNTATQDLNDLGETFSLGHGHERVLLSQVLDQLDGNVAPGTAFGGEILECMPIRIRGISFPHTENHQKESGEVTVIKGSNDCSVFGFNGQRGYAKVN